MTAELSSPHYGNYDSTLLSSADASSPKVDLVVWSAMEIAGPPSAFSVSAVLASGRSFFYLLFLVEAVETLGSFSFLGFALRLLGFLVAGAEVSWGAPEAASAAA